MGIAEDIAELHQRLESEEKEEETQDLIESIVRGLTDHYNENYRSQIDRKGIDFAVNAFFGGALPPYKKTPLGYGSPGFTITPDTIPSFALVLDNNVWRDYMHFQAPGKEYLEHIRPELESFAQEVGIKVLTVKDHFGNTIGVSGEKEGKDYKRSLMRAKKKPPKK